MGRTHQVERVCRARNLRRPSWYSHLGHQESDPDDHVLLKRGPSCKIKDEDLLKGSEDDRDYSLFQGEEPRKAWAGLRTTNDIRTLPKKEQ